MLPSLDPAPSLPLCPTGTAPSPAAAAAMDEALGHPDVVGSIVEQVAADNVAEACRLAVRWCGLTKGHRAQCDANSGLLWRQLTGAVFPTARAPTPADGAHGYKPKDAQSAGKEWFYYLCKQMRVMKERREDYFYAKNEWRSSEDRNTWFADYGTQLEAWDRYHKEWMVYQRKLATLEQKVRIAGHEYPQDVDEREKTLDNIQIFERRMNELIRKLGDPVRGFGATPAYQNQANDMQLLVLATRTRFHVEQEYMADLFQFPKPEFETDVAKANEAWSRLRKNFNERLQQIAGKHVAARRESARRFAVHQDGKDPREAELTALVHAAEAHLGTTPEKMTYAGLDSEEEAALRGALYDLKYARYLGRTLHTYPANINPKKAALESALAQLLD